MRNNRILKMWAFLFWGGSRCTFWWKRVLRLSVGGASSARPHFEPRTAFGCSYQTKCEEPDLWTRGPESAAVFLGPAQAVPRLLPTRWSGFYFFCPPFFFLLRTPLAFCKLAPDWSAQTQRRLWLAERVLLTEGGLRGSCKKKNSATKLHHAPPRSRFGIITGKTFLYRKLLNHDNAWLSCTPRGMILLRLLHCLPVSRRGSPSAMAILNHTGNFV